MLLLLSTGLMEAQTVYDDFDDFSDACEAVQPGEELVLANGTYTAGSIKIEDVAGTEENPVIIRAEEVGKVILNEDTYFDLRHSSYVTIQGFVINVYEKSTTFKIQTCNNIRITQNVIDGTNESYYKEDDETERNSSVWISIQSLWDDTEGLSHNNQIDHNTFQNKHTLGNMIKIDGTNEEQVSQYDVIEYNYFKNMGPRADNEMEVIRVGWSAMSESDGYCTIQNNLFEECNGDPEIISVKCNKNTVAHNTFRRCQGTLSLRHGNESLVEGNFFLGESADSTGGVRIYGSDHRIINNYFEGLTGTKWDAPITLTEGDAEEGSSSLSNHFRIERAVIANNTIVNCDYGIEIGYDNNGSYSKPPRDVIMANNIVSGSKNALVNYINEPIDMVWSDNILFAQEEAVVGTNVSFTEEEAAQIDPVLVYDSDLGLYLASDNSPVYSSINSLVGEIESDFQGQLRSSPFNYGADEFDDSEAVYRPLEASDVGVSMGEYINISQTFLSVAKEGEVLQLSITSNLDWSVSSGSDWFSVTPTTGSGDGEITITIEENNTGEIRSEAITIESTNAGDQEITKTIRLTQSDESVPFLTVSDETVLFSNEFGESELTISSNTEWSASVNSEWIELDKTSGEGSDVVKVTVQANETIVDRDGIIVFSDGAGLDIEVAVIQEGVEITAEKLPIVAAVASTEQSGNEAVNVFDGDLTNRWSGEGDGAFITLDMGAIFNVSFLKVGLYKGDSRNSMFDILVSEDGVDFTSALMDVTSEITDDDLVIYDFDDVDVRYVRIVGHGNSDSEWNSYTEFEIWGYYTETTLIEFQTDSEIKLYPNPSSDLIFIDGVEDCMAEIYNLQGICLLKQKCNGSIDVRGLTSGNYMVRIVGNEGVVAVLTFVKK